MAATLLGLTQALGRMKDWHDLLKEFDFPHVRRGGVTLVARADAPSCIDLIYASDWIFLGYDSFTVKDATIQPHLEWSPDWSRSGSAGTPAKEFVLADIASHPTYVTHYEFVFKTAA